METPSNIVEQLNIACPKGHTHDIIKYGVRKGKQIYKCKPCGKFFTGNGASPGRRIPPEQVAAAISLFYGGMSVREIQRSFTHMYDFQPSVATIYEWITDYTNLAKHHLKGMKVHTGKVWVADELVVKVGGQNYWVWDVMDADTRYLLASHISRVRTTRDAETLFRRAAEVADHPPRFIVTDNLKAYDDGIERVFGSRTIHIHSQGMRDEVNNNLSERLQGSVRQRVKVMRGLKSEKTAAFVIDGWALHYNYFRPHMSLENKTPAQMAGVEAPFTDWEHVARLDVRPFSHRRSQLERKELLRQREFKERPVMPRNAIPKSRVFRMRRLGG